MSATNKQVEDEQHHENPKIKGDWCNILLLIYMYVLQCIPRGLAQAVPLILQKRKVTYTDQVSLIFFITTQENNQRHES